LCESGWLLFVLGEKIQLVRSKTLLFGFVGVFLYIFQEGKVNHHFEQPIWGMIIVTFFPTAKQANLR